MTSQVISAAAGAAMAAALLAALDAAEGRARLDILGGATLICSTLLARPAGAVVDGALVLTVPTTGAIAYSSATPTLAVLYAADGTRMLDLRARLASTPDDPADPAAVVIQASLVEPGALLRVTAGAIRFA